MATYTIPSTMDLQPAVGTPITYAKQIHDALLAVGLTQTSDTGQMSMTSLPVAVATAGTSYGYTIYQWTDAYQSTFPLYMKIQWRTNSSATTSMNIYVTLGNGTDGAGTLTGVYFTDTVTPAVTYSIYTKTESYICYKDGALFVALMPASTVPQQGRLMFSFSRLIDVNTGNPVPGVFSLRSASTSTSNPIERIYAPLRTAPLGITGGGGIMGSMQMNKSSYYTNVSDTDVIVSDGNTYTPIYQSLVMVPQLVTCNAWVAPYSTIVGDFTWQRWGQTHTYKAFQNATWYAGPDYTSNKMNFAMRWD